MNCLHLSYEYLPPLTFSSNCIKECEDIVASACICLIIQKLNASSQGIFVLLSSIFSLLTVCFSSVRESIIQTVNLPRHVTTSLRTYIHHSNTNITSHTGQVLTITDVLYSAQDKTTVFEATSIGGGGVWGRGKVHCEEWHFI